MWTKKRFVMYRLYSHILVSFLLAGIISLFIWNIASNLSDIITLQQTEQQNAELKIYVDGMANYMSSLIKENNLSSREVMSKDFFKELFHSNKYKNYKDFEAFVINPDGRVIGDDDVGDDLNSKNNQGLYIYKTDFRDGTGFIIIKPDLTPTTGLYKGFIVILTILSFIGITLKLVGKQLKYIGEINSGIDILADGSLSYQIPEKGNNELTHLAKSINDMSISIKKLMEEERLADAKQRQLITNLSHDLRTPLTSIIGYLNLLSDGKYRNMDEAREYLSIAKSKSYRLEKLINDLFTYTKLTNKDIAYTMDKVDLKIFLIQMIEMQDFEANFMAEKNKDYVIFTDIEWLHRIFDNLFDNIRKYSIPDTGIDIKLESNSQHILLSLSNKTDENLDNKIEYLFDRMYVGNEDRSNKSSGLGLSIVKEYMKQMNSDISAEYENGEFRVLLKFPTYKEMDGV